MKTGKHYEFTIKMLLSSSIPSQRISSVRTLLLSPFISHFPFHINSTNSIGENIRILQIQMKTEKLTIILLRYSQSVNSRPLIYTLGNLNTPKLILITLRKTPRKILFLNSNADHSVNQEMYT